MPLCPQCKSILSASARHCPRCGASLTGRPGAAVMHGKYTILRSLSKGGMGALYLASETIARRERLVVVKEMLEYYDPKDPAGKVKAQQRFESEAAALVALSVAGVPQIFDYFSEGGRNYIVMQFIEGQNLETGLTHEDEQGALVKGKPYPIEQVCGWGVELCRILQALTAKNIIHMDIKPANLIVDPTGDIWLVDFGTVKAGNLGLPVGPAGLKKSSVYGTLGYAPPEQINGKAEARSDVYALAATLYHLMTDDDPADPPGAFRRINTAQAGLPGPVAEALRRALNVDVRQRATAAEFGHLLALTARTNSDAPFTWRDGSSARQPKDLAAIANRHWAEAKDYFTSGDWESWLRRIHQNNLSAAIQSIRSRQPDINLALDEFLRLIDPAFPAPRLQAVPAAVDAGMIPWKTTGEAQLRLENRGGGGLKGCLISSNPALRVEPDEFIATVADGCPVRIKIDSSLLSPSAHGQTIMVQIDAGAGGQVQLPVRFLIPEPELVLEGAELSFGQVQRGEALSYLFQVKNTGGSQFLGEARSEASWMTVDPQFFDCPPGRTRELAIQVDTSRLPHAIHAARMQVWARAGRWDRVEPVQVLVNVSAWLTFAKRWLPALSFIAIMAGYGGFFGAKLGVWLNALIYPMQQSITGALVGALLGAAICVLPATALGALGELGNFAQSAGAGKAGALLGLRAGLAAGVLAGGLAGWLAFWLLSWLGLLTPTPVFDFFSGLVGALSGGALGGGLYFLSRRLS